MQYRCLDHHTNGLPLFYYLCFFFHFHCFIISDVVDVIIIFKLHLGKLLTDRMKRANLTLKDSEEELTKLLDSLPGIVI